MDDGVIKYQCLWTKEMLPVSIDCASIIKAREWTFSKNWIGHDTKYDVGFGNISERLTYDSFLISGTQTGHISPLTENEFTVAYNVSISQNRLECKGPCKASSESLTHYAIYELDEAITHIIHIHDDLLWEKICLNPKGTPVTQKDIPYGTVDMALDIKRLKEEENLLNYKCFAMAGHQGGIFAFGKSFEEAYQKLIELENQFLKI